MNIKTLYRKNTRKKRYKDILHSKIKFILILVREFRIPNICVLFIVFGGGSFLYHFYYHPLFVLDFPTAMMAAFAGAFFEHILPVPYPWPVQVFYYIVPLFGIFSIANGITIFMTMLLGEKQNLQEWWIMTAETYRNHIVVCGVGKVGYRVINELVDLGKLVVGVEIDFENSFVESLLHKKIPIIKGNARLHTSLEKANVKSARTVICATNDDLSNIDCAFTAREIKPDIPVVLRIFDDNLAKKVAKQFKMPTVSTASSYAPIFAAKALGLDISQTNFNIYNQPAYILSLDIPENLKGKTVAEIEHGLEVKVLGYKNKEKQGILPSPKDVLSKNDRIIVMSAHKDYKK